MRGSWVFVCGPSGAGKDSIMDWARDRLHLDARVLFAQRIMTRPGPSSAHHQTVDPARFAQMARSGGLAWQWGAHGLQYGIPARYAQQVEWGRVVVVNGSREHVASLPAGPGLHRVAISASLDILAQRLARREREPAEIAATRLARNTRFGPVKNALLIGNDGDLDLAGQQLLDFLTALAAAPTDPCAKL